MAKSAEQRTVEIILKGNQANATLKEIQDSAKKLQGQLKNLPSDSQAFADKTKEFQVVNKRLKSIQDDVKGVGGVFKQISKEVKAFGLIAVAAMGFQFMTDKVRDLIKQNSELSDSFADIRKTTGMTEVEVKRLNNAFSQMNTRTSTKELRNIAIAAGQLGIAKKDVLSFTAATDKLVVALGDEFQGGAEQVTKEMGALRNIFTDMKSDNISEDMLHIGNAINELASSGAATGPVVSDFANRIGGVGINLGLTSGQVLGLSATLQELNVSTERGGTAVSKILMKMTQDTDKFAKVAGMSTKEFTDLVNKDLYGAFVKVAEGSKKGGTSATEFSHILDALGVDGAGASEVFAKLGSNTKLLQEKVDMANVSLQGTDSIMNEFNIKNDTFGAKIDKIGKSLTTAFVNGPIMKGLDWMASGILKLTTNTHAASQAMAEEQTQVELSKIKILSYNVGNTERTKLLKELKDQYPDYLANLDAEKASNDQVREAIDGVINSLVSKIVVQRKQEEIADQAENIADAKEKQLLREAELLESLRKAYSDNTKAYYNNSNGKVALMAKENEGLPIQVAAQALLDAKNSGLSRMNENIVGVADALDAWKKAEVEYNSEAMKGNDIQKEKDELMKRLGIGLPGVNPKVAEKAKAEGKFRTDEEIKANEKINEARKKLLEDIGNLEIEFYLKGLDADTKEIAEIDRKYGKLLKEAGDFEEAKARIRALWSKEIETALVNQAIEEQKKNAEKLKKVQELQDEIYLVTLSANDRELVAEMQKWDALIEKASAAGLDVTALRQASADAIAAIVKKQGDKEVAETKKTEDEKEKLRKEKFNKIVALTQAFASKVDSILSSYDTIQRNRESEELRRNDARLTDSQNKNNEFLKAKLISQKEYDKRTLAEQKAHDKREADIKKKAYEREQKLAIAKAIINGAIGITQIWGTYAATPYIAAALTIIEAAAIGLEIAAIKSAPKPYAKGGFNKTSDDPQGYTTDATLYTKSATGTPFIAGEKGVEWISPSWMVKDPQIAPIIEHLETIRQSRSFASGGSTKTATAAPVFTKGNSTAERDIVLMNLSRQVDRLCSVLDDGIEAYMDYDRYTRTTSKIDNAKNAARVG
ncbi:MAG: phage tail tape measure protein [Bacteroidetes bacterium RIFCSPLOWO2_12_FULL_35_15]|nr:MAG: phage tail tape measure protein [Bacteroidetes bacterium RIFCSPLOWO2_12_FULL_35_15]